LPCLSLLLLLSSTTGRESEQPRDGKDAKALFQHDDLLLLGVAAPATGQPACRSTESAGNLFPAYRPFIPGWFKNSEHPHPPRRRRLAIPLVLINRVEFWASLPDAVP
jgi:hypothetical protein